MSVYANRYTPAGLEPGGTEICTDTNLDRKVRVTWGLKALRWETLSARLTKLLNIQSPHILDVYDIVHKNDQLGIVHEYCDGPLLSEEWAATTDAKTQIKLLYQVVRAVAELHAQDLCIGGFDMSFFRRADSGFVKLWRVTSPMLQGSNEGSARDLESLSMMIPPAIAQMFGMLDANNKTTPIDVRILAEQMASHLLRDTHRAILGYAGKIDELSASRRGVTLTHPGGFAQIAIHYDGLGFKVKSATGEVYINNQLAAADIQLPGACVIALGGPNRSAAERKFITFDISHPSVVL